MIPRTAHFVWIGREFPWLNVLAIRSAILRGGFERVVLHHTDDLTGSRWWDDLQSTPRFTARRMDPPSYLADCDNGDALIALYPRLVKPAAKSDILRAAILAKEGGVYLDLDTVTLASLEPLCQEAQFFCGSERIAWPDFVVHSNDWMRKSRSAGLGILRYGFRMVPGGWRGFRRVESLYYVAVCPGIMAGRKGHPLLLDMLHGITEVPADRQNDKSAIGPHLLQKFLRTREYEEIKVHPPEVFYPLPPEISWHWFKPHRNPALDDVLSDRTRIVHWYSSVSNRGVVRRMSPEFVRENADRQMLSALARPFLDADFAASAPSPTD